MKRRMREAGSAFLKRPFPALVSHFVNRLFASEEEQGGSSLGFGIGAVLAILASPGAFASIFLMGKYSTLLQWMRGEHIDAIRRSPSDEYFFVVLSMTITGFVMVARWNRLFPDRRDFLNLAPLPIPIRNIFVANFVALLSLALVFALDVNVVSAVLFPLFVTMSYDTFPAFLKVGSAHIVTVFSASLFSFFAIFGLVGLLMLIVPRRLFRKSSVLMRVILVVVLLAEFFSNILLQLFSGRAPGEAGHSMSRLPSYWFLGLYEHQLGIANLPMTLLGRRAIAALIAAIVVSTLSYVICYRTWFVRLPEMLDMMGTGRSLLRVRWPESLLRRLFRSPFERACSTFAVRVLLRSEQHLMFFGAYLGIGLVVVAQSLVDSRQIVARSEYPSPAYLAIPLLIAFFIVSGLKFAFDMPVALDANWVFKLVPDSPYPQPKQIARRLMRWITVPAEILLLGPSTAASFGWRIALVHSATTVAFTLLFIEVMLTPFEKVPFTCSTVPDVKRVVIRILGTLFGVLLIVPEVASLERWAFAEPGRFLVLALVLFAGWILTRRYGRAVEYGGGLRFEDGPGPPFEILKLTVPN